MCPKCDATLTKSHKIIIMKWKRWLYVRKKIKFPKGEDKEHIRRILIDAVKKSPQEFAHLSKE